MQIFDLVVHAVEGGVEVGVHSFECGVVEGDFVRDRLDGVFVVVQFFEGRGDVRVDAGAYSAQDGGPQAGCLLHVRDGDLLVHHGGFDAHEQAVLGPAADGVDGAQLLQAGMGEEWF